MNVITRIIIFREDIITHKTDQIDLWYYEFKFKNWKACDMPVHKYTAVDKLLRYNILF